MVFSRIELDRASAQVQEILQLTRGDGYQDHRLVWSLFADGPERRRDFLYRRETSQGWPVYYTVSERPPAEVEGLWRVSSKPYRPNLKVGDVLCFSLRVNPVRTKSDPQKGHHRHDVVMDAKRRLRADGGSGVSHWLDEIVRQEGEAWLEGRCTSHGFSFRKSELIVDGYRQHVLHKKKIKISFSTMDFNGVLRVTEPSLLLNALCRGIGPAKSFGCGLMMVKRR
ncbi:MAG: type I-E CRISPR-associated protein Cas6/Cse3/CasE [Syntrophobacteraceae bacterium]|nr:type I-E CRISPR-associated protein Cas6/Cse3/CasE [Syntrophobacteraceae bacterium]